jgi:hypothetical protein
MVFETDARRNTVRGVHRTSRLQLSHSETARDRDFATGHEHEYQAWNPPACHFLREKLVCKCG